MTDRFPGQLAKLVVRYLAGQTMGEEEQLILRWHHQEACLARNLLYLYDSELFTDITLSVGHHSVKAHRLVLASCSTYFLQLFKVSFWFVVFSFSKLKKKLFSNESAFRENFKYIKPKPKTTTMT